MSEIKRVFTSGRMNKDIDERLIQNGEYRDAVNIRVTSDSDGNSGAVQNINGNTQIGNIGITGATVVGSIVDTTTDYIYWLIKGDTVDAIARSNGITVEPVLVDTQGVLNFTGNYITGINIIESDFLTWTDNNSEPKIIDISDVSPISSVDFSSHSTVYGNPLVEEHITVIKKKPSSAPNIALSTFSNENTNPLFETEFARFAYRWKFSDGQYSVFSPFSETAFIPGNFGFSRKTGYNKGMENLVKEITLTGFSSYDGVESIEILVKKSNDNNIYVVESIPVAQTSYILTSEQIYSLVSSDQILRQWDAVPKKALAQELIANRIVYGNYQLGENTGDIIPQFDINLVDNTIDKAHIKSNRTYQFGIVLEDKYGRQTPVLSNKTGSFNIPFGDASFLSSPKKFTASVSSANYTAAALAERFEKFKYFIKETSNGYYNVFADSVFPNPEKPTSSEVWIAFLSTEINKFKEGDFLLLKKYQSVSEVFASPNAKFKVLEVSSNAPDFMGTDYSADTTVTSVTDFQYHSYDIRGRFFVRLEDVTGILAAMYTTNPAPVLDLEQFSTINASFSQPLTSTPELYLGKAVYESNGTTYVYDYYMSYDENTNSSYPYKYLYYSYPSTGYNFYQPAGALVEENITLNDGTTTIVIEAPGAVYEWHNAGVWSGNPDSVERTIYVKWNKSTNDVAQIVVFPDQGGEVLIDPAVFETEADNNVLDIYYETEQSFDVATEWGTTNNLKYFNCFNFGSGVESDRIRDDFNETRMSKQVRVSTVLAEQYREVTNSSGLIWSGLYNSRNSINRLNQFSTGESITKDLNPEYGSIQKLHSRDTDLISFCEDKVLRILASKDALYNADGSTNVTLSSNVLGQAVPYAGEFGISKNPESFASYGYRAYFTDKSRTAVLRLSMDGLELISARGMQSYFDSKLKNNTLILGSYDEEYDEYNITFADETVSFKEQNAGWTSIKTFIPESACSLNGEYYTFKSGEIWKHSDTSNKNAFYGQPVADSTITFIYNEEPSTIKNFYTLGYEGSEGWEVSAIHSDLQNATVPAFVNKEGKYFGYIRTTDDAITDLKQSSVKGIGTRS